MRRKALLAPMMTLFLLCACGGGGETEDPFLDIQAKFQQAQAIQAEVVLTCDYQDEVRTYGLFCAYTPEKSRVEVTAPETVAGVAAAWDGEAMTLSYDDMMLDAGPYSDTDMSPLWAVPALLQAAAEGYPLETGTENLGDTACLRITFETGRREERILYHTLWLTGDGTPLRGEIAGEEGLVYTVEFESFTIEEREGNGADAETDLGGN